MSDTSAQTQIIPYVDFAKVDLRVGKVVVSNDVPESEKLLRLVVDFGQDQRVIFTGLAPWYEVSWFTGKTFVFVYNLSPKKIMGEESQGMLLSVNGAERPIPVQAPEGSKMGEKLT